METSEHNFIPFAQPEIGNDEITEVVDCLKSGWLTTGPKVDRFEKAFSKYTGCRHALAVNSATAGLHLALEAAGIESGDLVVTTPYTFTASAEVIRYLGADPIFADIDPNTFNLCPSRLGHSISSLSPDEKARLKAIIPVHFAGQACDMSSIKEIAEFYGLKIIEDAAHALPSTYNGKMVGTIGDATVFSFYVTKTLATGEGGMVTTNCDKIAKRIKIMRLHGISHDIWDRYTTRKPNWYYEVVAPGFKYNMPDLMAAIGLHQLKKIDRFQLRRNIIAKRYDEALIGLPLKLPLNVAPNGQHAWHLYVIQLDLESINISRDIFIEKMAEKGIGTSVHFIPLHIHPYWAEHYGYSPNDFPVALDCYLRAVSLPIYSKMSDDEVDKVIKAVKEILS